MAIKEAVSNGHWTGWVGLASRLVLGGVLLVAGILKLGNLQQSVVAVSAYDIVGPQLSKVIGWSLPVVEIVVGLMLIVGLFTRFVGFLGAGLMLVFILGIASAWVRGISLDCGCFGGGGLIEDTKQTEYLTEIIRDIVLMSCGVWLVVRPKAPFSLDNWVFAPVVTSSMDQE